MLTVIKERRHISLRKHAPIVIVVCCWVYTQSRSFNWRMGRTSTTRSHGSICFGSYTNSSVGYLRIWMPLNRHACMENRQRSSCATTIYAHVLCILDLFSFVLPSRKEDLCRQSYLAFSIVFTESSIALSLKRAMEETISFHILYAHRCPQSYTFLYETQPKTLYFVAVRPLGVYIRSRLRSVRAP